jgi:hypothetical protein
MVAKSGQMLCKKPRVAIAKEIPSGYARMIRPHLPHPFDPLGIQTVKMSH